MVNVKEIDVEEKKVWSQSKQDTTRPFHAQLNNTSNNTYFSDGDVIILSK